MDDSGFSTSAAYVVEIVEDGYPSYTKSRNYVVVVFIFCGVCTHAIKGQDFTNNIPTCREGTLTVRLSAPIEKPGIFWLPSNPTDHVQGTLRISETGQVRLEVFRYCDPGMHLRKNRPLGYPPAHQGDNLEIGRILGLIGAESITLDGCHYMHYNAILTGGISTSTIHIEYAFFGVNYDPEEQVRFSRLVFSVEGLDEWLGISGFRKRHNFEESSVSVDFKRPEEAVFRLPGGIKLKLAFEWRILGATSSSEVGIVQRASFSLIAEQPRPVQCLLGLASKLSDFLRLAMDKHVLINSITGFSCDKTRVHRHLGANEIPIKMYYQSTPFAQPKPEIQVLEMLFRYKSIDHQFEEILSRWLENYKISEPAFNLYFATKSNLKTYLESRFLSLTQALEVFHRSRSGEKQFPEKQFRKLVNALLNAVEDTGEREFLKVRLKYANELSNRKRIKRLIKPMGCLLGDRKEQNCFVSKVVDTRNYLTHFDKQLAARAARGEELWKLYRKLEALIQLHFMLIIGLELQFIKAIVNENHSLREKLELEYQEP